MVIWGKLRGCLLQKIQLRDGAHLEFSSLYGFCFFSLHSQFQWILTCGEDQEARWHISICGLSILSKLLSRYRKYSSPFSFVAGKLLQYYKFLPAGWLKIYIYIYISGPLVSALDSKRQVFRFLKYYFSLSGASL